MIERETSEDRNKERLFYIKSLGLITPEEAYRAGLKGAEAPVFVSPIIKGRHSCGYCHKEYGPLVYQTGYVVVPEHYHEAGRGGIFVISPIARNRDPNEIIFMITDPEILILGLRY